MAGVRLWMDAIRTAIARWGSIVNRMGLVWFEWNVRRSMSVLLGNFAVRTVFASYWRSANPIMIVLLGKHAVS